MKRAVLVLVLVLFGALPLFAQDPTPAASPASKPLPKQISGGVLNGKATSLPKPQYPPAAREESASGTVTVQVLVDEDGNVVTASAVSGHPLLRPAAVVAAKEAKFSPVILSGTRVKVSGVIVYNFVADLSATRLAFVLSYAERTGMFGSYGSAQSLAAQLPKDWVEEKEILNGLTFEESTQDNMVRGADPSKMGDAQPDKPQQPTKDETPEIKRMLDANKAAPPAKDDRYAVGVVSGSYNYTIGYGEDRKLDARSAASLPGLIAMIERRADPNSASAWNLKVGRALGTLVGEDDRGKMLASVDTIESLLQDIPLTSNLQAVAKLREFAAFARSEESAERVGDIRTKAEALSNLRF